MTVLIKGTTTGVAIGLDGSFSIKVPGRESILAFSYVGYVTKEERVDSGRIINVELAEDVGQLKEVVVVGFGVQEKASVIGAIATIEPKSLGSTSKIALSQSLAGNIRASSPYSVPANWATTAPTSGFAVSVLLPKAEPATRW